jgi:hypothetical protein
MRKIARLIGVDVAIVHRVLTLSSIKSTAAAGILPLATKADADIAHGADTPTDEAKTATTPQ